MARGIGRRRAVAALAALAGAALAGAGAATVAREASVAAAYSELAGESSGGDAGDAQSARRDWASLASQFPAVCAWCSVGGTPIDLPVVACSTETDERSFLKHDLWGEWSLSRTPFMDHRCLGADARNVVAYGHHMTSSDTMFSCLQRAYEQEVFDGIGHLLWETPAADAELLPLCAMSVVETWPDIQTFDFAGDGAFRQWLASIVSQASAVAADSDSLVLAASRCVALVTCSSDWANQAWRTVTVWVG